MEDVCICMYIYTVYAFLSDKGGEKEKEEKGKKKNEKKFFF